MKPDEGRPLVIGHLTVDDIVLSTGETSMEAPGGDSLYAALGARVWGLKPSMIACRADTYSQHILDQVDAMGVDTRLLQRVSGPGVRQWALYDTSGGRQYHAQGRSSSYLEISPRVAKMGEVPALVSAAHVAPMPGVVQKEWVEWLHGRNCPLILLDPHEDELSDTQLWREILPHVTVFLPSIVEVAALLGSNVSVVQAVKRLADWGPKIVIIKMGERGSLYYERDTRAMFQISAFPAQARDSTGCGDAFCGGFMAGLCQLGDPRAAAQWGSISASFVLEGYGPYQVMKTTTKQAMDRWATIRRREDHGVG